MKCLPGTWFLGFKSFTDQQKLNADVNQVGVSNSAGVVLTLFKQIVFIKWEDDANYGKNKEQ